MASSPSKNAGSVVEQEVLINNTVMAYDHSIESIEVEKLTNRIAKAKIVLNDGEIASGEYPILESADIAPGANIEIKAGFDGDKNTIFKGVIVGVNLHIGPQYSTTVIECADHAIALTRVKVSQVFTDITDSDIIAQLVSSVPAISAEVDTTRSALTGVVQQTCTPWQFILGRAKANGMLVWIDDNECKVKSIQKASSPVLTIDLGANDASRFEGNITATTSFKTYTCNAWSSEEQKVVNKTERVSSIGQLGNISAASLAAAIKPNEKSLRTDAQLSDNSLSGLAKAESLFAELSSKTGRVTIVGSSQARLGEAVELKGVSQRFNGTTTITGVQHTLQSGSWQSTIKFGLDASMLNINNHIKVPEIDTIGMPRASGMSTAKVIKIDADPGANYRVKVQLINSELNANEVWARLSSPYSSNQFGFFFFPEIGDEVLVGFIDDNPNEALILGSVYSSKLPCKGSPDEHNTLKAISTRAGLQLEFNDQEIVTTLSTPEGNMVELDEKNKTVTVTDATKNKITLNEDGISLESPKSISIKAKEDVNIEAMGDVSISGKQIGLTGKVSVETKAPKITEQADGVLTIKGSMVMIN